MIEQDNHKNNFSAQDIERYHAGKMTPQEMHVLEKSALDDPFLADALEGYQFTPTPTEDVKNLRQQLHSRLNTRVVPLWKKAHYNQVLKIAAMVVLVAGIGWTVYQFAINRTSKDLAVTAIPAAKKSKESEITTAPTTDTIQSLKSEENEVAVAKLPELKAAKKEPVISEEKSVAGKRSSGFAPEQLQNETALQAPAAKEVQADVANIDTFDLTTAASSDQDASANSVATQPQKKENVIVLQRAKNNNMPEVVIGKSRKDSSVRRPRINFEEAEPVDGQLYYDDYVAQNLQLPETEKFKTTSGEVKLSFDINDSGQAVNITVEKSLCSECDKEAVRLLKQGPKLVKKKKNKKGKLSIRF